MLEGIFSTTCQESNEQYFLQYLTPEENLVSIAYVPDTWIIHSNIFQKNSQQYFPQYLAEEEY